MGDVINALKKDGLPDDLKIMIGGNPVSESVMERVTLMYGAPMHPPASNS